MTTLLGLERIVLPNVPSVSLGDTSFGLANLSSQAKKAVNFLATHPNLVTEFEKDREKAWKLYETYVGPLSEEDRGVLTVLYNTFVSTTDTLVVMPINGCTGECWQKSPMIKRG